MRARAAIVVTVAAHAALLVIPVLRQAAKREPEQTPVVLRLAPPEPE